MGVDAVNDSTTPDHSRQSDLDPLAQQLGLRSEVLASLHIKREGALWIIPERNADGETIGFATRSDKGKKGFKSGGKRGLTMVWPLDAYAGASPDDPILVVEGMSDAATAIALGFKVIGRPSATGGLNFLPSLLRERHVVIISENDSAGQNGALKMADGLIECASSVRIVHLPENAKDLREWFGKHKGDRAKLNTLIKTAALHEPTELRYQSPVLVNLADVEPEELEWLWPNRIPLGKVSIIAGDPGLGKSFITLDMASRISRGVPWIDAPDVPAPSGGIVILNAEDDLADTIRPRLDACEADVSQIFALDAVRNADEGDHAFNLENDLQALEEAVQHCRNCRLVIIDPITAYLGGADGHKNSDIRGLLAPLATLAAKNRVAVVAVSHLNKNGRGPAIYRTMGSLAFVAAARAAWLVTKDRDNPDRRLFLSQKNNLAPNSGGLAYSFVSENGQIPRIAWERDKIELSADEALSESLDDDSNSERKAAADWLLDALADGPMPAEQVKKEAKQNSIAERTLKRAKRDLDVEAHRKGFGGGGKWYWSMPGTWKEQRGPEEPKGGRP